MCEGPSWNQWFINTAQIFQSSGIGDLETAELRSTFRLCSFHGEGVLVSAGLLSKCQKYIFNSFHLRSLEMGFFKGSGNPSGGKTAALARLSLKGSISNGKHVKPMHVFSHAASDQRSQHSFPSRSCGSEPLNTVLSEPLPTAGLYIKLKSPWYPPSNWLKIDCIPKQNLDFSEQTFKGSGIHLFQTSYFYRWKDNTQTNAVTGSKCLQLGTCARAGGRSQPSFASSVFFALCFCILDIHLNL